MSIIEVKTCSLRGHTLSKSDRRVSMSVVMEGMLSTHWQYSRIILISSNTVLEER